MGVTVGVVVVTVVATTMIPLQKAEAEEEGNRKGPRNKFSAIDRA